MLLLIFLIIPIFAFTQQEGQIKFKVRSNHYYEFEIPLRGNTQYYFKLKGQSLFTFRIVEPSCNEWSLHISDNNEIHLKENIMDKGVYTIRVYSIADNYIIMEYGEY